MTRMSYSEAVSLYKQGRKREAVREWDAEFQLRLADYDALPEEQQTLGGNPAADAFWSWEALVCNNCGKGPGQCDGESCAA